VVDGLFAIVVNIRLCPQKVCSGELAQSSQSLLAGHLNFCKQLVLSNAPLKEQVGSQIIRPVILQLLMPASQMTADVAQKKVQITSEGVSVLPLCSEPASRTAAFNLIVELCHFCLSNLERVASHLQYIHSNAVLLFVFCDFLS
jgi:hypothetical protein